MVYISESQFELRISSIEAVVRVKCVESSWLKNKLTLKSPMIKRDFFLTLISLKTFSSVDLMPR